VIGVAGDKFSRGLAVFAQNVGDKVPVRELVCSSSGLLGLANFRLLLIHLVRVVGFSGLFPLSQRGIRRRRIEKKVLADGTTGEIRGSSELQASV